jgi:FKBP-type peptidyl-prolyl cis-trans isomerase 2
VKIIIYTFIVWLRKEIIFYPIPPMKKLIFLTISCLYCLNFTYGLSDFQSVVLPWLYSEWLTKWQTVSEFRGNDGITRWEAAKFMSVYAQKQWLEKSGNQCSFQDIGSYDSTLFPSIVQACEFGLLKWTNGNFMPNQNITEAQALAVVIRSAYWFLDESGTIWYRDYFTKAQELWFITNETLSSVDKTSITRAKLWVRLYEINALSTFEVGPAAEEEPPFYAFTDAEKQNLASCLAKKNIIMYGTEWCSHCKDQKALFGDSFDTIEYIDCDANQQACIDAGVRGFPTWIDKAGKQYPGTQSLAKLDQTSSCNARIFPIVAVDYIWTLSDGTMFDTSLADEAKKWWIYDNTRPYEPLTVALGKWETIPWFEEAIFWMKPGDSKTIILSAEQAYWERRDDLVATLTRSQLWDNDFELLQVGSTYNFDVTQWTVITKNSNSVTIDFNHPLAGKALTFFITIPKSNTQPTQVIKTTTETVNQANTKLGMTWWAWAYNNTYNTTKLWCREWWKCDAYLWDTICTELVPVLCIKENTTSAPTNLPTDFYNWRLSADIQFTKPVAWNTFKTLTDVNTFCVENFGQWWRVGEFHDWKGWWWFYVKWDYSTKSRFWININDQPSTCRSQS